MGEAEDGDGIVGRRQGVNYSQAAGFTTGSNSSGYTLQSVTVKTSDTFGSPTGMTAAIHAASGGNPATSATYTLTGRTSPAANAQNTYTCSGTCSLNKETEYYLVLLATFPLTGNNYYTTALTLSNDETNTPANAGWSIADVTKYRQNVGNWYNSGSSRTLLFKVTATKK